MAWAFGTSSTFGNSSSTSRAAVGRPASIASGDWQVLTFYIEGTTGKTLSFTNGTWTKVRSDAQAGPTPDFETIVYISQYAGEGATFDLSWGGANVWNTGVIERYTGGDSGSVLDSGDADGTGHVSASSSTTVDFDGFTPVNDNCLIHYSESDYDGRTNGNLSGTTPTLTERVEFSNVTTGDGNQTTAAAIGNRTSTLNAISWNMGQLFALTLTAPGGGGGTPRRYLQLLGVGGSRAV